MPDQIQDQNQSGAQVNGQPVMGGNPYDLIDNKNQESIVAVAPTNVQTEQTVPVAQQAVGNNIPVNNQVDPNNSVSAPVQNVQVQTSATPVAQLEKVDVAPSGFTKKLISFIAKISGQPDPETGAGKTNVSVVGSKIGGQSVQQGQIQNQAVVTSPISVNNQINQQTSAKNPFDAVMGGVTGFLDKVEKKVETAAGIDLDAPINKSVENQPVAPAVTNPEVPIANVQIDTQEVNKSENIVVDPVVASVVEEEAVKTDVQTFQPVVSEPVVLEQEQVKSEQTIEPTIEPTVVVKQEEKQVTPAVDAVKTEINSVENNIDSSVNPVAQNIQFGESVPQINNGE